MKRVADSQLTKDSDDGDDGPEVIVDDICLTIRNSPHPFLPRRPVLASRRPQRLNSPAGSVHVPSHNVRFPTEFRPFVPE